ncbi:MAG: hypothetical protein HQ581_26625, partial [Planctomycetes bacterium]|nr:hypothetical protein [Planctomycetota bacterium]
RLESADADSAWLSVFRLILAGIEEDRAAMLAAASRLRLPGDFPGVAREKARLSELQRGGLSRNAAALAVIRGRRYEALYALRDLDRRLTREADFLDRTGQAADAAALRQCRDRLRDAYLDASRHLVERLFALKLLGRDDQRSALLERAGRLEYLTDGAKLEHRLANLSPDQAWQSCIRPLLESEVALIDTAEEHDAAEANDSTVEMTIRSRKKHRDGASLVYTGSVEVRLGRLRISCRVLTLTAGKPGGKRLLQGMHEVVIDGLPGTAAPLTGDMLMFETSSGEFEVGGNVYLVRVDAPTLKCRRLRMNTAGRVLETETLLDAFAAAASTDQRLGLLPMIAETYADDELPSEARYMLALTLLAKHLTWHAAYAPPPRPNRSGRMQRRREILREEGWHGDDDFRWEPAHGGEAWMRTDLPREQLRQARDVLTQRLAAEPDEETEDRPNTSPERPEEPDFFWRLTDPDHKDVARAVKLLRSINEGDLAGRARHWLAEIQRNNTVVTADVAGAYAAGKKAPVVVDVRNADRLSLKLYRVDRPEVLLDVTRGIGEHFVFRDYGLQYHGLLETAKSLSAMHDVQRSQIRRIERELHRLPRLAPDDLVHQWHVDVAQLKALDLDREENDYADYWDDEYEDQEAEYFDDRCWQYRQRLEKSYWPGWKRLTSWQCDRLLEVPGEPLDRPGAYVLAIEANGQTVYAPIVVDPLCLVLRRCRDGVFAAVSDTDGDEPLAGARIHADGMLGRAITNTDGVAFARLFAAGDRAIVAERDGRYAVGGFGRVFEGVYRSELDGRHEIRQMRALRDVLAREETALAHAYADRYVVAAYTDRPVYRPGQEVGVKLIVRRLPDAPDDGSRDPHEFRAGDFDWAETLQVPEQGTGVSFDVLDPKGRSAGGATATLNDFGTAAAGFVLPDETAVGSYTLRVRVGGMDRIVPAVFSVKYYRRPNFALTVADMPQTIAAGDVLKLQLSGQYYFGRPVAGGTAEVRLVRPEAWKPLVRKTVALDEDGTARLELTLPKRLAAGAYRLIGSLTDPSGRTVTTIVSSQVESTSLRASDDPLSDLPRFVAVGEPLEVRTTAKHVVASQARSDDAYRNTYKTVDGAARVVLPEPGWYTISAAGKETEIFAYGGDRPPGALPGLETELQDAKAGEPVGLPRWVNLSNYEAEEDGWRSYDGRDRKLDLTALMDRQHVTVGGTLRVLLYVPARSARLLLTVEGRTIVDYVAASVTAAEETGCYHVVEFPIKERYLPNFYLQGRILSAEGDVLRYDEHARAQELAKLEEVGDGSEDPLWCRVDVIDPDHRPGGQQLDVTVQTGAAEYRPGQQVDVSIRATDPTGAPCEAEVSLAAVDQSVFAFGSDRVDLLPQHFSDPHPLRRYLRKTWRIGPGSRRLNRSGIEMAHAVEAMRMAQREVAQALSQQVDSLQQLAGGRPAPESLAPGPGSFAGEPPAASVPLARLRTDFRETAAWQPQLRTGPDGTVRTSFRLPDSLTRYRLTCIALTRQTEIGVARTTLEVTQPLAVQLFLPRFAVEGDRLQAVGLIHNATPQPRTCDVAWEVTGASVEPADRAGATWQMSTEGNRTRAAGRVDVPAGESVRLAVWLNIDGMDEVRVALRAADGDAGDAESRALPVHPLGRAREVTLSGSFTGRQALSLPAGFVARDLRVSIARTDIAGGLEGLAYLIDYPYGCVEQTMSRFLPAVMAKRAAGQSPVSLPPEALEKLPDVLRKGLDRLYGFQHDDGSWGWWSKDRTDDRMTAYVVYGLARCRNTGTPVDQGVLDRGCQCLRRRLADGTMPPAERPAAWLALSLAGRAEKKALREEARRVLTASPQDSAAAYLALACRHMGLVETGERLWARMAGWQAESTDDRALKLCVQIAYGAPLSDCRVTAARILASRRGHRWGSTRSTAWAIEALSQMLRYDALPPKARRVSIRVGGETVLDLTEPEQLDEPVCRVHLDATRLPATEGLPVVLVVEGAQPANYTLTAVGVQRLDKFEPVGDSVRMHRALTTVAGKPLSRRQRPGDVIAVHLSVELQQPQSYVIVEDRRPAVCEFADDTLHGPAAGQAAHVEFRDDRLAVFFASLPAGRHELVYYLRAETAGKSCMLPGIAYPMYNERLRGETAAMHLEIDP